MTWKVYLTGNETDLKLLSENLDEPSEINEDEDKFYMISKKFDGLEKHEEVREIANKEINIIYAMSKVGLGPNRPLSKPAITSVVKESLDGSKEGSVSATADAVFEDQCEARDTVNVTKMGENDEAETVYKTGQEISGIEEICHKDEKVRELLDMLNKEDTYVNLYRIYEFIQEDLGNFDEGNMVELGWVSKSKKERFTSTVNSRDAIGDRARHGKRISKPKGGNKMESQEAKNFVYKIVKKWIEFRKNKL